MKQVILFLVLLAHVLYAPCQGTFTLSNGGFIKTTGGTYIVLESMHLTNAGNITQASGDGVFKFTGSNNVNFSGAGVTTLSNMEINKSSGNLVLQNSLSLVAGLTFSSGNIDLGNNIIDLQASASLIGETESRRSFTTGTGYIQAARVLNAPLNNNPAGLGVLITSSQNLGTTTIRRGHRSQVNAFGNGNSILRYYDIIPTNNTALNATLRFTYFDAELNGLPEGSLALWRSQNNTSWTNLGFNSRNATLNYVEKTGIQELYRFTLSTPGNALPVHFLLFNAKCIDGQAQLSWKTAQEINTSRFDIESSANGLSWQRISSVLASGNSSTEQNYSILVPAADQFFRVVAIDLDGRRTYTSIIKLDCERKDDITAWPVPVKDALTVKVNSSNNCNLTLMLHDAKGSLLIRKEINLGAGQNQLQLDISKFSNGPYMLRAEWNHYKRTIHIVKQ